jgi:hypothetical protein
VSAQTAKDGSTRSWSCRGNPGGRGPLRRYQASGYPWGMSEGEIISELREAFANVPRPGIPEDYVPSGRLGNPGWDEFTYHSALVFAEQLPDHLQRVFDSPEENLPKLLWHLSDSERLAVFSPQQLNVLLRVLDFLEAEYAGSIRKQKEGQRLERVRSRLEALVG